VVGFVENIRGFTRLQWCAKMRTAWIVTKLSLEIQICKWVAMCNSRQIRKARPRRILMKDGLLNLSSTIR